jgi:hypothetical protein
MRVQEYTKGSTFKRVLIVEIHPREDRDSIVALALDTAGETMGRLFGLQVDRRGSSAMVTMHTD